MRIGLLSNFWYRRGGLERVMLADARELEARGHAVAPFVSAHPLNEPSPWARHFPPNVDHGALGEGLTARAKVAAAARLFHHGAAVRAFEAFVDDFQPDVVHQHGTSRQLSPSVLERGRGLGLPTVLTLHDYSLRCPAGTLSRAEAPVCVAGVADSCAGHRYDRAVRFRCVHDSRAASALAAVELLVARALRRYERAVDLFLVPSDYVRQRMLEAGLSATRVRVLPNAIEPPGSDAAGPRGPDVVPPGAGGTTTIVGVGRLVESKGFGQLVEAARSLPTVNFVVAGDGSARSGLEAQADGLENIRFVGQVAPEHLGSLVDRARAVVVPSEWPEPFGMVVLEAWQRARPVIASNRGALPEIVDHRTTGLVYDPAEVGALVAAIAELAANADLADRLGAAGQKVATTRYSMAAHVDHLEQVYHQL